MNKIAHNPERLRMVVSMVREAEDNAVTVVVGVVVFAPPANVVLDELDVVVP